MVTSFDNAYLATKLIKQGQSAIAPPWDELARWIAGKWNVTVLNVTYDAKTPIHAKRLQVIVERETDATRFSTGRRLEREDELEVVNKAVEVAQYPNQHFSLDGVFVVVSAFAPLAIEEANRTIPESEIARLQEQINDPQLWCINRLFGTTTFMFYTDKQVKRSSQQGLQQEYSRRYCELLKQYDEFAYLAEVDYSVEFDSKQNLDENFGGSWANYYR